MPDVFSVFTRWWKYIIGLTLLALVVALGVSLFLPKEFLSTATALPANTVLSDKARIFNKNIQSLYSVFGSEGDLDKLQGTADLDTIYIAVAAKHDLAAHYQLQDEKNPLIAASKKLRKNSRVAKSDYGELKIMVWDTDPAIAAQLSNGLLEEVQQILQALQAANSTSILNQLKVARDSLVGTSNVNRDSLILRNSPEKYSNSNREAMALQLATYDELISEYALSTNANPPVLLTVEKARPAVKADKPKLLQILVFSGFAALIFSFLLSFYLESRDVYGTRL